MHAYIVSHNVNLNGVPVEQVGRALEQLAAKNGGLISKTAYVEIARPKSSPVHETLEWDDPACGELWRMQQAGSIIKGVRVCHEEMPPQAEIKPRVHISYNDEAGVRSDAYAEPEAVVAREDWRLSALREILFRIRGDLHNHDYLIELAPIADAVEQVIAEAGFGAPADFANTERK